MCDLEKHKQTLENPVVSLQVLGRKFPTGSQLHNEGSSVSMTLGPHRHQCYSKWCMPIFALLSNNMN